MCDDPNEEGRFREGQPIRVRDHLSCSLVEMFPVLAKMFHFHSWTEWQLRLAIGSTWPGPIVAMRLDEVRHLSVVLILNYLEDLRGTTGIFDMEDFLQDVG